MVILSTFMIFVIKLVFLAAVAFFGILAGRQLRANKDLKMQALEASEAKQAEK